MGEAGPKTRKEGAGTPVPSLEAIDTLLSEEQDKAEKELAIIGESLRTLAQKIEQDRPDVLVFLDLSARILAAPYQKYLSERMGREAPLIRFYNDHELKGRFLAHEDLNGLTETDFEPLRGKKIFFIDETFSEGKGALALLEASAAAGIDGQYFALTKDPEPPSDKILSDKDRLRVEQNIADNKIVIYDHPIHNLFSRFGSRLYVQEHQGTTRPVQVSKSEAMNSSTIPHADSYMRPPEGMSMEEYQLAASAKFDAATREMKEKIYQTLIGSDDKILSVIES